MDPGRSARIVRALRRLYGDPAPSLKCGDLYQTVVSVILSAQTTDTQVNAATPALFKRYPDFGALAKADTATVEALIKSTGFYRDKAKHIVETARAVMERFDGVLPDTREELMSLPGVGRKSANVILAMGYGRPAMAVDTHVLRVSNRLGYCSTDDPAEAEKALTRYIPERDWISGHLLFITHGRRLCRARRPLCADCPLSPLCDAPDKTL